MRRSLNVHRALRLFYGEEDAECEPISSSSSEEESGVEDDEVTDPPFVAGDEKYSDEENKPSTQRLTQRARGKRRPRSPQAQPHHHLEPGRTGNDPDTAQQIGRFMPRRTPGAQVDTHAASSPLDLFQLYFSPATVLTLCENTNRYAAKNKEMGKKYNWADVEVEELYKFLGLLMYTSLVSLPSITDYWKQDTITSVPFPATVMPRDRFRALLWNLHPSDPEEDKKNDEKKGSPEYDKLFGIKPIIDSILSACQAHYHPRKELAVHERVVAAKAKTGMARFMKDEPMRSRIKLFVLADSSNGYTINFNIYVGKTHTVHGLSYDAVMHLIQPSYLGTGYHVYLDNICTSPQLYVDLASMKFGVSGGVVKKRVKEKDGCGAVKSLSCPVPITAYNKNTGGVCPSDQLLQYYSTHRRSTRWYRTLFLQLMDIATTNAYILHCDISFSNEEKPMSHKDFQAELVSQLCGVDSTGVPMKRSTDHVPVPIAMVTDASQKATQGRRTCQRCLQVEKKRKMTPWKCQSCDVALCLIVDRNCFAEWHR